MPCPPNTVSYTIRQGDTLYALAAQYNTTVPAIVSANPGIDPQRLTVGQEICIPQQAVYPPCPEGNYYTIRAGDTLYAIARQFNVSLDDLLEANPGIEPFQLQVGQVICIPVATPPAACPEGYTQHTIVAGDTFFALAQRYGVTVDAIRAANSNVNPNALLIGQTLCIPPAGGNGNGACPEGYSEHIVAAGDTLFRLAQQYGVTVDAIRAANPGIIDTGLQIGRRLCIPPADGNGGACPEGYRVHTVAAGDTYFALAQRYGVTVDAIRAANPNVNPNALRIGQTLCIPPADGNGGACPEGYRVHTVAAGDTYFALAQRYGVTVDAIRAANPNVNPNALRIGQTLCIPPAGGNGGACPEGYRVHTVAAGDTYFRLAQQYGVTVNAIRAANPNVNPNALRIGQTLCIPPADGNGGGVCPEGYTVHTVAAGDTFFRLARRYGVTINAIRTANPNVNPNALRIGQTLCIPPASS